MNDIKNTVVFRLTLWLKKLKNCKFQYYLWLIYG